MRRGAGETAAASDILTLCIKLDILVTFMKLSVRQKNEKLAEEKPVILQRLAHEDELAARKAARKRRGKKPGPKGKAGRPKKRLGDAGKTGRKPIGLYPHVSRSKLAVKMGMHIATVSHILSGRRRIFVSDSERMAEAIGVSVERFTQDVTAARRKWLEGQRVKVYGI